jgi:tRNA modification GTPase
MYMFTIKFCYLMLAQRPAAIVTPSAGTTRDIVEVSLDLGGFSVQLADTAGLREVSDEIEKEGIKRARMSAKRADLVLLVASAPSILTENNQNLELQLKDYIVRCGLDVKLEDCIVVLNKADLVNQVSLMLDFIKKINKQN